MPDLVVWQQRIYFQKKKLKTLKSRKLKKNTSEKAYMSFLVFGSTAYLKDNCFVKIALSKLGL